ncbi:MAG: hypothetical protein KDN22_32900 [Verrucomicrobiae bacterium]|nr:hypothetical protein [Verrucomicrobiae bacterium]
MIRTIVRNSGVNSSPFARWTLTLALFAFALVFVIIAFMDAGIDVPLTNRLLIAFGGSFFPGCAILALWGVRSAGRIVAASIFLVCLYYVLDECVFDFQGDLGLEEGRSATSPINAIWAMIAFGLPCLYYAICGRLSISRKSSDPAKTNLPMFKGD